MEESFHDLAKVDFGCPVPRRERLHPRAGEHYPQCAEPKRARSTALCAWLVCGVRTQGGCGGHLHREEAQHRVAEPTWSEG